MQPGRGDGRRLRPGEALLLWWASAVTPALAANDLPIGRGRPLHALAATAPPPPPTTARS